MATSTERFVHRDPSAPAFWDERIARQFVPWDQRDVPAELAHFVGHAEQPMSVFVPGCGMGHEVNYLVEAGWPVVAIDFSPETVNAARAALGTHGDCVAQADFFSFVPPMSIDFIYERAFLCALPRSRWPDVIHRWAQLLPVGGLLGGFFFFDSVASGPPFGADRSQLDSLMQPYFELLDDRPAAHSVAVFAGRERWQVWQRRDIAAPQVAFGGSSK